VAQKIENLILGGVRAKAMWKLKIENGVKTQNRLQEVSAN